ncbi:MAG: zf-HC2 domain-containing protein [Sedimentisphaerales bacterium]|nr:zf-HC2 domain-containing protein [Sedimentisphaerales bacterium]
MKNMPCENIQEMLVDYSDGLLAQEENRIVSQHLDKCENCRKLSKALNRSLELSNVIWEDNLREIENVKIQELSKTKKVPWLRYASIAASILIVVTTGILWRSLNQPQKPEVELSFEEIEKNINDSANAVRLLAATQLLENYPDYKELVDNQYQYIAQRYPDTSVAKNIKLKIQ